MNEVYRLSSSERIQQMERELALHLNELKTEIEENGVLRQAPSQSYSSVPVPKDISYFRKEREIILRKGLQVAEAKSVIIQADIMHKELESCIRREYTAESLPLLLHQFFTDRIHQLVQSKYLHMLRWKRFCQHASVSEQLYPLYKKHVGYIMQEYNDALQRAQRLSAAREHFLTGHGDASGMVTAEDLVIYLQWLVCHLHSLKTIHSYLRVLQYLPLTDRMKVNLQGPCEEVQKGGDESSIASVAETSFSFNHISKHPSTAFSDISGSAGNFVSVSLPFNQPHTAHSAANSSAVTHMKGHLSCDGTCALPLHKLENDDFSPQLQQLVCHFGISYDVEDLRNTAHEMELFALVGHAFRSIFSKQQTMKKFPGYDSGFRGSEKWGTKDPSMALKKEANWIPFLKIKPKKDPWQQKMMTKLQEEKKVDELLRLQSQFMQVSDPDQAMGALREHAVAVFEPYPIQSLAVTSHQFGQHTNEIWKNIYGTAVVNQEQKTNGSTSHTNDCEPISVSKTPTSPRKKKDEGFSYVATLQLLGLDEGKEENTDNPVLMRGAYLSFLYLRHLKIRELKRKCLGILNYFRSVERTLTISTSGITVSGGDMTAMAEDTCYVSAARGGIGVAGGLGSHHYLHNTPADFKVHSVQFMEFSEVENHDDFYTAEDGYIHTQDQQGNYIIYDAALTNLMDLESQLLLVATYYIDKEKGHRTYQKAALSSYRQEPDINLYGWAHLDVDRFAVLLDLWTCEAELLENKKQLLDSYFESFQHAVDPEGRFALAQIIINIMHRRPRFDFESEYFVSTYESECICLQLHLQLIRDVMSKQIDEQREYIQMIWRDGQQGSVYEFGLPPNIIPKQLISLNNSSSSLKNIYFLEFHPSLRLAALIPKALDHIYTELYHIHRPATATEAINLEKQVLQLAKEKWLTLEIDGSSYSSQIQKDLFSDTFMKDPYLVRDTGVSLLETVEDGGNISAKEKQTLVLETFSKLLELVTLRHRLIETASETALLARLYKTCSVEMGFEEYHLYLRPVQFEFASHKDEAEQLPPVFITALLEDDSNIDRYTPSSLLLSIQEIDELQIGKFSFRTREAVLQLLSKSGVNNLQVALACQVVQKNALIAVVQQATFCHTCSSKAGHTVHNRHHTKEGPPRSSRTQGSSASGTLSRLGNETEKQPSIATVGSLSSWESAQQKVETRKRPPEAFISIQLEKLGPRDMMLNEFIRKRQTMGTIMKNPEDVEKVKRELILSYCQKFCFRMSHYSLRGQIIAYYNSLTTLLSGFPSIRDTYFMMGVSQEKKGDTDSKLGLHHDPRKLQQRPRCLLSADGGSFLNLWFIPDQSELLIMFKTLDEKVCQRALSRMLQIVAALHGIVSFLLSFAQLGECTTTYGSNKANSLSADWGGLQGIGAELNEIQKQIDSLKNPTSPSEVITLLNLRREVLFLQFDAAVRHLIREAFLSTENIVAYHRVTDHMYHALPALSNSLVSSSFSSQLSVPQPLNPCSDKSFLICPWRTFLATSGLFPVIINEADTTEYSMQLCLCSLKERERKAVNGALIGVSLLMEDVLQGKHHFVCFQLENEEEQKAFKTVQQDLRQPGLTVTKLLQQSCVVSSAVMALRQDPIKSYTLLRSFLILWKQLEVFKESWGRLKLHVEDINTVPLYKQFVKLYRTEILFPTMRFISRQLGKEDEYEGLISDSQTVLAPKGASEVEIKARQLQKILESLECHMITEVQKKITKEMTLVISERARQDSGLPTELWKHAVMKENFSAVRPQIVEKFVQKLMEKSHDTGDEVCLRKEHLQKCLTSLACDVMARERSNYETYSMFYENVLRHEHQLLYQKEQELKAVERDRNYSEGGFVQAADLSHDMIVEITALRARLSTLEEENQNLKQTIRKEVQNEYELLVRNLFLACFNLKAKLDEYHISVNKRIYEMIGEVRQEAVENIISLKKRMGATRNDDVLKGNLVKHEQMQALRDENIQFERLVCKLKTLSYWKQNAKEGKLHIQLRALEQEVIKSKKDCVNIKMIVEEEVILLRQQLATVRKALANSQTDYEKMKQELDKQKLLLKEFEHRVSQEARSRQQIDNVKTATMERLFEDMDEKEQQLRTLTDEYEKQSKMSHFQQSRIEKEIRQIKHQLSYERGLKLDAFQRVDELQTQVYDFEASLVLRSSLPGSRKSASHRCHSASSFHGASLAKHRNSQSQPSVVELKGTSISAAHGVQRRIQRPKTVPSKIRSKAVESLLPDVMEADHHSAFVQLHDLRIKQKFND